MVRFCPVKAKRSSHRGARESKSRQAVGTRARIRYRNLMNEEIRTVEEALEHPEVFRVSIFGSARTKPEDSEYQIAEALGYQLGQREISVVTGGGPGQMEAANKGHRRALSNTNSIGLTVRLPYEDEHNDFLDMESHFQKFGNRLDHFMALSNAVVITAGGIGTCLELFYTLQLTQVKHICPIPIILLDPMWEKLFEWLQKSVAARGFLDPDDLDNVHPVAEVSDALRIIDDTKRAIEQADGDACINSKMYKLTSGSRN